MHLLFKISRFRKFNLELSKSIIRFFLYKNMLTHISGSFSVLISNVLRLFIQIGDWYNCFTYLLSTLNINTKHACHIYTHIHFSNQKRWLQLVLPLLVTSKQSCHTIFRLGKITDFAHRTRDKIYFCKTCFQSMGCLIRGQHSADK